MMEILDHFLCQLHPIEAPMAGAFGIGLAHVKIQGQTQIVIADQGIEQDDFDTMGGALQQTTVEQIGESQHLTHFQQGGDVPYKGRLIMDSGEFS